MPTIIFSPSSQLKQVEDFPASVERSVKGAIHVRPGTTCVVTDGEAAHLKARGVVFTTAGPKPTPPARVGTTPERPTVNPGRPSIPPPALDLPSFSDAALRPRSSEDCDEVDVLK